MKFSHRTIYGLRALLDLAYHGSARPIQLREVAERAQVPVRFLEQIFLDFKQAGLVESKRGPKGGYVLAREPGELSMIAVFEAVSDAPSWDPPAVGGEQEGGGSVSQVADGLCVGVIEGLRARLGGVTLADLMERAQATGVARECYERFVYVI